MLDEEKANEELSALSPDTRLFISVKLRGHLCIIANCESNARMDAVGDLIHEFKKMGVIV